MMAWVKGAGEIVQIRSRIFQFIIGLIIWGSGLSICHAGHTLTRLIPSSAASVHWSPASEPDSTLPGVLSHGSAPLVRMTQDHVTKPAVLIRTGRSFTSTVSVEHPVLFEWDVIARNDSCPTNSGKVILTVTLSGPAAGTLERTYPVTPTHFDDTPWLHVQWELDGTAPGIEVIAFSVTSPDADLMPVLIGSPIIWSRSDAPGPPNVVMVVLDSLRADYLGAYGSPVPASPFLDQSARRGMQFLSVTAPCSWTAPSMNSLFTGCYPDRFPAMAAKLTELFPGKPVITECFAAAGYRTVGVSSSILVTPDRGFDRGFDTFDAQPAKFWSNGAMLHMFNRTRELIRESADKPFFLFLHAIDPHDDYIPPSPFNRIFTPAADIPEERIRLGQAGQIVRAVEAGEMSLPAPEEIDYLKSVYRDEIRYVDGVVEWIIRIMTENGAAKSPVLCIVSDHGEEFMDHGWLQHGATLREESVKVPWILCHPSQTGNRLFPHPVSLVDVCPTLAGLFRIPHPEPVDGLDVLKNDRCAAIPRYLFSFLRELHEEKPMWRSAYWGSFKAVHIENQEMEYWDLSRNPQEISAQRNGNAPDLSVHFSGAMNRLMPTDTRKGSGRDPDLEERLKALGYIRDR